MKKIYWIKLVVSCVPSINHQTFLKVLCLCMFYASIWEAVFIYVSLACNSAFQFVLVSSCCSVLTHTQIISINIVQPFWCSIHCYKYKVCVCVFQHVNWSHPPWMALSVAWSHLVGWNTFDRCWKLPSSSLVLWWKVWVCWSTVQTDGTAPPRPVPSLSCCSTLTTAPSKASRCVCVCVCVCEAEQITCVRRQIYLSRSCWVRLGFCAHLMLIYVLFSILIEYILLSISIYVICIVLYLEVCTYLSFYLFHCFL